MQESQSHDGKSFGNMPKSGVLVSRDDCDLVFGLALFGLAHDFRNDSLSYTPPNLIDGFIFFGHILAIFYFLGFKAINDQHFEQLFYRNN